MSNPNIKALGHLLNYLNERNLSIASWTLKHEFPVLAAVQQGNLSLVKDLVASEWDVNDGPSIIRGPLPMAITNHDITIAQFLVRNRALEDLGDLFVPLRIAVLSGNMDKAEKVLQRQRKPPLKYTSSSLRLRVRHNFKEKHTLFLRASETSSSQSFQNIGVRLGSWIVMWRKGISAIRWLVRDRLPKSIDNVISIIVLAWAIQKLETYDSKEQSFLNDLNRWKRLAVRPKEVGLYNEIIVALWPKGKKMSDPEIKREIPEDRGILKAHLSVLMY